EHFRRHIVRYPRKYRIVIWAAGVFINAPKYFGKWRGRNCKLQGFIINDCYIALAIPYFLCPFVQVDGQYPVIIVITQHNWLGIHFWTWVGIYRKGDRYIVAAFPI